MPPYSGSVASSQGPPIQHPHHGQHIGVPMPPASVSKGDEETGSLSYDNTTYMEHIELDGQTKISALDDPTLIADYSHSPSDDYERTQEEFEAKARLWRSLRRKVCCTLLLFVGLIVGVVFLLQSFGEQPESSTTTIAASNSNANDSDTPGPTFAPLAPTWAPYGNDNTDDFFDGANSNTNNNNNISSREPENGFQVGNSVPQNNNNEPENPISSTFLPPEGESSNTANANENNNNNSNPNGSNLSGSANLVSPNQAGSSGQQQQQSNGNGGGDREGCRDRDGNGEPPATSLTKGGGRWLGWGNWFGGGGGGGGGGGDRDRCRDRDGNGGNRRLGGGRCGCRGGRGGRGNGGGGGGGGNRGGGGGGNRRSLWEYLFAQ